MATVIGTILATGQAVEIVIPTVRIPELPELSTPIEGDDEVAVYDASENSTRQQKLSKLRNYFITGGAGTGVPPVLQGNDLEIIADETNIDGDNRVLDVSLLNKTFTLERVGYGQLLTTQFLILPSGGFELVDDTVRLGDVFFAHIYSALPSGPGGTTNTTSLVNGIALITDDTTLNTTHNNKLLHLSSPTKNIVVTLPDIATAPADLIVPLESTLSNGYYSKIETQGGQFIYINGSAVTYLWLAANEFLWLLRGVDGWYVMKASDGIFNAGQPFMDYAVRLNSVEAKGQPALRSSYPRLFDWLSANPSASVTDAIWLSTPLTNGKFSLGDGTTTFRFPNHQNQVYRGLNNIGGADAERPGNTAGLLQLDMFKEHNHTYQAPLTVGDHPGGGGGYSRPNSKETGETSSTGGVETRMKNLGLLPLIRV